MMSLNLLPGIRKKKCAVIRYDKHGHGQEVNAVELAEWLLLGWQRKQMKAREKVLHTDVISNLSARELLLNAEGQTHLEGGTEKNWNWTATEWINNDMREKHLPPPSCEKCLQFVFLFYIFKYSSLWTQPTMNPCYYFTATGLMVIMLLANTFPHLVISSN